MLTIQRGLLALVVSLSVVGACGCQTLSQERVVKQAESQLPSDWISVSSSDWRFRSLPPETREAIDEVRLAMARERETTAFIFYGRYSDGMYTRIGQTNDLANKQFVEGAVNRWQVERMAARDRQVSPGEINRHLTPELMGIAERPSDIERNMAVVGNQNLRLFWGDLGRVFLFDQPSYLSPYNITSTSGQP